MHSLKLGIKHGIKCFFLPPQNPAQQGFFVLIRHVVTKHRSDLHLSSNLQVRSNVILSRVGAILLVSCTLQTRALVHTPRRNIVPKRTYLVLKKKKIFSMKKIRSYIEISVIKSKIFDHSSVHLYIVKEDTADSSLVYCKDRIQPLL